MSVQDHAKWIKLNDGTNTVELSLYEALGYSQTYEKIGGRATFRTLDGTGVKQQNWVRLKTTVSGNGGLPLGMSALDYAGFLTLSCGAPRSISSANNAIVVPAARRTDDPYNPTGLKRINGFLIPAPVVMAGNTATVTPDGNADSYAVLYYPEILVMMNDPSESFDIHDVSSGWSFTAEEK